MTQWGMLLLCVYIALGVSRFTWRRAGLIAFGLTVIVITAVIVSYSHGTPADKYYPDVDSSIYATGQTNTTPNPATAGNSAITEDTTGVQPATFGNTDHPKFDSSSNSASDYGSGS